MYLKVYIVLLGSWSLPPRGQPQSSRVSETGDEDEEDGPHWTCSVCTFRNHPALGKCEQCEMPRISLGTDSRPPPATSHVGCFCHPNNLTLPATPLNPVKVPSPTAAPPVAATSTTTSS